MHVLEFGAHLRPHINLNDTLVEADANMEWMIRRMQA
jgi:hypothetical protein